MRVSAEFVLRKKVAEDPAISPRAKALFFYILCQNREKFVYKRNVILAKLGWSQSTYLKARKELVEKQIIITAIHREGGRIKGMCIAVVGVDSNSITTHQNTVHCNTERCNTERCNLVRYKNINNKKINVKEDQFLSVPTPEKTANEIREGVSVEDSHDNTEKAESVHVNSGKDLNQPSVLQISDYIHQLLAKKGMYWTPEEENKRAEKIDAYYSATNWTRKNGQKITNWPAVVRACLANDNYRPPKIEETERTDGVPFSSEFGLVAPDGSYLNVIFKNKQKELEEKRQRLERKNAEKRNGTI